MAKKRKDNKSSIDAQIEELLVKKLQAEALRDLIELVLTFSKNEKYQKLGTFLEGNVIEYLESLKESIESGENLIKANTKDVSSFSSDEIKILKILAQKSLSRAVSNPPTTPQKVEANKQEISNSDNPLDNITNPLEFSKTFRHLDNKEIILNTKDGPVEGKVVGSKPPRLIVATVTGYKVEVKPSQIVVKVKE